MHWKKQIEFTEGNNIGCKQRQKDPKNRERKVRSSKEEERKKIRVLIFFQLVHLKLLLFSLSLIAMRSDKIVSSDRILVRCVTEKKERKKERVGRKTQLVCCCFLHNQIQTCRFVVVECAQKLNKIKRPFQFQRLIEIFAPR